ncbi:MAG: tRNA (adenosine(37)-N6)-threonylcarbamoyltransferase complex dimerization subunit type 1 TsaB [Gaiellales bacterium]
MVAIALDTATGFAAVGVLHEGAWHERVERGERAAQSALGLLDAALAEAAAAPTEIDRVVVGCGPGSFTALRIGLAMARGLADAAAAELCGVSTLAALLAGADEPAVAVIDARRGEVFAEGAGIAARAIDPAALAAALPAGTLVVGDGALAWRGVFENAGARVPPDGDPRHAPRPSALLALADRDPQPALALYLRDPDAVAVAP